VPISNKLLAALPRKDYQRISASVEQVTLEFGQIIFEPGDAIRYIYFPNDALVSLLTLADGHLALEVGMVGCEGMVGAPMALGISVSPVRALVQGTGTTLRMTSARFQKEFDQCQPFQRLLHRYVHVLMTQVTQTAACNRFHVVEKRLARWLLMTLDRVSNNPFQLTQEFLAHMLGVRRVGVTKAASALQQRKLISYSRGNITILDRAGLEAFSCGCYRAVKDTYELILR
jgi:CRP-like cAMP-binding protein